MDTLGGPVNPVLNYRSRDYGPASFDRTHVMTIDYVYNLPNVSKHWNNAFARIRMDGNNPQPQLYNLANDPGEQHDLAAEHPERVRRMLAELGQLRAAGRSRP